MLLGKGEHSVESGGIREINDHVGLFLNLVKALVYGKIVLILTEGVDAEKRLSLGIFLYGRSYEITHLSVAADYGYISHFEIPP